MFMHYYQGSGTDSYMQQPENAPLYAGLARKAIHHYLGDLYNPDTFNFYTELFIRRFIKTCVELKVFDKQPYDWNIIDHFLRMVLHDDGYTHLTYDLTVIEAGYHGVVRGDLPTHHA
jgi:hypothetical protein